MQMVREGAVWRPRKRMRHSGYELRTSVTTKSKRSGGAAHPEHATPFSHFLDLFLIAFEFLHELHSLRFLLLPRLKPVEILQALLLLLLFQG